MTASCCPRPATSRRRSLPAASRRWRAASRSCRRTVDTRAPIRPTRRSASPPARRSASIRKPGAITDTLPTSRLRRSPRRSSPRITAESRTFPTCSAARTADATRWSLRRECRKPMTASSSATRASTCRARRSSTPGTRRPSSRPILTSASRSRRTTPRSSHARSSPPVTSWTVSKTDSPPIWPPARRPSISTASLAPRARPPTACRRPKSRRSR